MVRENHWSGGEYTGIAGVDGTQFQLNEYFRPRRAPGQWIEKGWRIVLRLRTAGNEGERDGFAGLVCKGIDRSAK